MKQHFSLIVGEIGEIEEIPYEEALKRYLAGDVVVWSKVWTEDYPSGSSVSYNWTGSNDSQIENRSTVHHHLPFPLTKGEGGEYLSIPLIEWTTVPLDMSEWKFAIPV